MKKKILHVSSAGLNHGGVASVIFSIVESLESDFDFDCVVFNRKSDLEEEFEKHGTIHRIHCYPKKGKRDYVELLLRPIKLYFGIRKICKTHHYDVIHCHNQRDEWICLLAAKHAKVPMRIAHSHVTTSPKKRTWLENWYRNISPRMLRKVATVSLGCSELACSQFYAHKDYMVIPNSIDLEKYCIPAERSAHNLNFVHVGRFTYAKNQEFVLETFAHVCKALPQAHLYLVGYGEPHEVEHLKTLIDTLGITENVEMIPGDAVDISAYYAKSQYMIFPSRFEGFGIVLLEAQATGIQCYVSENIQQEVDVGLLHFLQLSDGPKKWAEFIVSDIQNGPKLTLNQEKLSQYSNAAVCAKYAAVYRGEM